MQSKLMGLSAFVLALTPAAMADTQSVPVDGFSKIVVKAGILVNYTPGPESSVTVEQEAGDFSDIDITVSKGKLKIGRKSLAQSGWGGNRSMSTKWRDGKIVVKVNGKRVPSYTVTVTSPDLESLKATQSSKLIASGLNLDALNASASSSGDIELVGQASTAQLEASSSGTVDAAEFIVASVKLDASSSGEVYATSIDGELIDIDASSSGDVKIVTTGTPDIKIDASSSADVSLEGACNFLTASISSSADVSGESMSCKTAEISTSSSGDLSLNVTESVIARASSGGDIEIGGSPAQRDVTRSSGGDVDFVG